MCWAVRTAMDASNSNGASSTSRLKPVACCAEGGSGGDEPLQLLAETTLHEPGACSLPAACGKCRAMLLMRRAASCLRHMLSHPAMLLLHCLLCLPNTASRPGMCCAELAGTRSPAQSCNHTLSTHTHKFSVQVFTIAPKEPHPTDAEVRFPDMQHCLVHVAFSCEVQCALAALDSSLASPCSVLIVVNCPHNSQEGFAQA